MSEKNDDMSSEKITYLRDAGGDLYTSVLQITYSQIYYIILCPMAILPKTDLVVKCTQNRFFSAKLSPYRQAGKKKKKEREEKKEGGGVGGYSMSEKNDDTSS